MISSRILVTGASRVMPQHSRSLVSVCQRQLPVVLSTQSLTSSSRVEYLPAERFYGWQQVRFKSKKKKEKKEKPEKKEKKRKGGNDAAASSDAPVVEFDFKGLHQKMGRQVESFAQDLKRYRAGRVTPDIFDHLMIADADGTMLQFSTVAQVAVKSPKLMVVTCFDQAHIPAVEQSIKTSNMGFNPEVDTGMIKVQIPPVTKESREDTVKLLTTTRNNVKIHLQNSRRDALKKIKASGNPDDEKRNQEKKVDQMLDAATKKIVEMFTRKEAEVRQE